MTENLPDPNPLGLTATPHQIAIREETYGHVYELHHPWPDTQQVILLAGEVRPLQGPIQVMASFQAFPLDVGGFFFVERATIAEAEVEVWQRYQLSLNCQHQWDRGRWKNGCATCGHCGLFGVDVLPPLEICFTCGQPTNFTRDSVGNYYCEQHDVIHIHNPTAIIGDSHDQT